jgi:hypothetical protein
VDAAARALLRQACVIRKSSASTQAKASRTPLRAFACSRGAVLLAVATLTLVGSLLGAPRQRRWPTAPRIAARNPPAPDRSSGGRSGAGGPSVLAFVFVACRGPRRARSHTRRGRASARRVGPPRVRAPGASLAALMERALVTIGSWLESGWTNGAAPVARG